MSTANLAHIIADFEGVSRTLLDDAEQLVRILSDSARCAELSPLASCVHKFLPAGVSAVLIIAESHISIHTWPEEGFAAVDIFSCGAKDKAFKALGFIRQHLAPSEVQVEVVTRGRTLVSASKLKVASNEHGLSESDLVC